MQRILPWNFAKFHAKSFTVKQYFERHFKEMFNDISGGQTKNLYVENLQKQKIRMPTNKSMSNKIKQQIKYGKVTEM